MKNIVVYRKPKTVALTLLIFTFPLFMFNCTDKVNIKNEVAQKQLSSENTNVAILVFPGVELLDLSGPAEVFSNTPGFEVYTVSLEEKTIVTKHNTLSLNADYVIADAPQPDILVLPGAPMKVVDAISDKKVTNWIRQTIDETIVTMSVCTGVMFLAKAGLLDNRTATSHMGAIDKLQDLYPQVNFLHDERFVEDGNIVTTAGVSAGIDGALHVVKKLKGVKRAMLVTGIIQYDCWNPENGRVVNRMKPKDRSLSDKDKKMDFVLSKDTKDVVCGMTISKGNSKYRSIQDEEEYYFCSLSCNTLFDKNPELFAAK